MTGRSSETFRRSPLRGVDGGMVGRSTTYGNSILRKKEGFWSQKNKQIIALGCGAMVVVAGIVEGVHFSLDRRVNQSMASAPEAANEIPSNNSIIVKEVSDMQPVVMLDGLSINLTENPNYSFASLIDIELAENFDEETLAHEFGHILQQRSQLFEGTGEPVGGVWLGYVEAFDQQISIDPVLKGVSFDADEIEEDFADMWAVVTIGKMRNLNAENLENDLRYLYLREVKRQLDDGTMPWPTFEKMQ